MTSLFDFGTDELVAERDGCVAILRLGLGTFDFVANLEVREKYLAFFDQVDKDPDIRVLLTINEEGSSGSEAYAEYLASIVGTGVDLNNLDSLRAFRHSVVRQRQIYLHQYSIRRKLGSTMILAHGLRGEVVTPFIGESLASDLRFATENMRFSFAHAGYGLPPGGALSFFLPKFVGQGRALEWLMNGGTIDASQALEMGLVNRILPADEFEKHCIAAVNEVPAIGQAGFKPTRVLNTAMKRELEHYLEAESNLYL